mgnify:CR=1 FL=1
MKIELLFQMSLLNSRLHFGYLRLIINADISFVVYPRFLCHGKLFRNVPMTEYHKKIFQEYKHDFSYKSRDI